MNNIGDILNTNICKKNIIWVEGFCENIHSSPLVDAINLCENCGEIRCNDCIANDNKKCIGCISKNILIECGICKCINKLRICKKCCKLIYYCRSECPIYSNKNILTFNGHYCKECRD